MGIFWKLIAVVIALVIACIIASIAAAGFIAFKIWMNPYVINALKATLKAVLSILNLYWQAIKLAFSKSETVWLTPKIAIDYDTVEWITMPYTEQTATNLYNGLMKAIKQYYAFTDQIDNEWYLDQAETIIQLDKITQELSIDESVNTYAILCDLEGMVAKHANRNLKNYTQKMNATRKTKSGNDNGTRYLQEYRDRIRQDEWEQNGTMHNAGIELLSI